MKFYAELFFGFLLADTTWVIGTSTMLDLTTAREQRHTS
jgi:hypothetical protein